jgi:hypothetical protein
MIDAGLTAPRLLAKCSSFIGWDTDSEWVIYRAREYSNEGYSINVISTSNQEQIQLLKEYGIVLTRWMPLN